MAFEGMDPQKVLAVAKVLRVEQQNLTNTATAITRIANGAVGYWRGPDGVQFRGNAQRAQAQCVTAGQSLAQLIDHAVRNAVAQLATSDQYGPGGSSAGALAIATALWNGTSVSADGSFRLGPDVKVSGNGTVLGVPVSGSAHAWAGVQGNGHAAAGAGLKDGLYANANGTIMAGAGADANGSIGNSWLNAKGAASIFGGGMATGAAGAHLGLNGVGASASASGMVGVDGKVDGSVGDRFLRLSGNGEGFAGAQADGHAGAGIGTDGVEWQARGSAFAGAKATGGGSLDILGITGDASVTGEAGAGVEGGVGFDFNTHDIGGDFDLGAALGLGGDLKVGLHIDPAETLSDASSLISGGWNAVTSAFP